MCRDVDHGGRRCPSSEAARQRRYRATRRDAEARDQVESFIGATPFRPESGQLMPMSSRPGYYDTDEWIEFDDTIRAAAERRGVEIVDATNADGLWMGDTEPAGAFLVRADDFDAIRGWAAEIAGRYEQDSVMAGAFTDDGPDSVYSFDVGAAAADQLLEHMREAGVAGGRVYDGRLEVASLGSDPVSPAAMRLLAARFGEAHIARAHVEFITADDSYRRHTPIKEIQLLRQNYAAGHGFPVRPRMPHLTPADDIAAARAYAAAEHQPRHRKVARSYRALRQHIAAQWDMLVSSGYIFEPWHGHQEQPYADSAGMIDDLRRNRHLYYFRTEISQHTDGALPADHPMAANVHVTMPDGRRQQMLANDVFRAVHDAIAHSEGHTFGPFGEKRAWWTHRSCLPREARLALWCETRAQNCWTNAGPHMTEAGDNGTLRLLQRDDPRWLPLPDRPYAEQKCVVVHPSLL